MNASTATSRTLYAQNDPRHPSNDLKFQDSRYAGIRQENAPIIKRKGRIIETNPLRIEESKKILFSTMPKVRPGDQDRLIKEMLEGKHGVEKKLLAKDHMKRLGYTYEDEKYIFGVDKSKNVPMGTERKTSGGVVSKVTQSGGVVSKVTQSGGGGVMGKFEIYGPLGSMMVELKKLLGMKSGYSSGRISQKHVVGMVLIISALMLLKRK